MSLQFQRQLALLVAYLAPAFYNVMQIKFVCYKYEFGKYILELNMKGRIVTSKNREDMIKAYNLTKIFKMNFRFKSTNGDILEIQTMSNMSETSLKV